MYMYNVYLYFLLPILLYVNIEGVRFLAGLPDFPQGWSPAVYEGGSGGGVRERRGRGRERRGRGSVEMGAGVGRRGGGVGRGRSGITESSVCDILIVVNINYNVYIYI
jgi:hypothetical protein